MHQRLRDIFSKALPDEPIVDIQEVVKGDVHYVFKILGQSGSYYYKQRKEYLRKYPEIKIDPATIGDEATSLSILNAAFPKNFPKIICFDKGSHSLLMEDVLPDGGDLIDLLQETPDLSVPLYNLGRCLADIHDCLSMKSIPIKNGHEKRRAVLGPKFNQNSHTRQLMSKLEQPPFQPILGDLSPKNIGLRASGQPVFFDIESFHYGNKFYDAGFLGAHLYLHYYESDLAKSMLSNFLAGYQSRSAIDLSAEPLFWSVFNASILYRLDVPEIRYPIQLSPGSVSNLLAAAMHAFKKETPVVHLSNMGIS